jgi:hypothetical protein
MRQFKLDVTADAGGTGSASIIFSGLLMNVYAVPESGMASTVDFTIVAPPEPGIAPRTLLTGTNIGTSGVDYPLQVNAKDATGTAISGTYLFPIVVGTLTFAISGGTNGKKVTFYVIVLDSEPSDGRR